MSKRRSSSWRTPGSGLRLKGAKLFKAISLEEHEKLPQEEEMEEAVGEGAETSQGKRSNPVKTGSAEFWGSVNFSVRF